MLQARTEQGDVRESNQDVAAATELPDGTRLLVVADGVGGSRGGGVASETALEAVLERLEAQPPRDPEAGLREAFEEAHLKVRAARQGELSEMSTTLVGALIRDGRAWIGNVGDSRAYLVTDAGAQQITRDHSWVEEQISAGRLSADDPAATLLRNLITRTIGGEQQLEVDLFGPLELTDESVLLLCTDGLHGVLEDEEIAQIVNASEDSYIDDLVAAVFDRGSPDNVAIALYQREANTGTG